jgi:hypothetical protein
MMEYATADGRAIHIFTTLRGLDLEKIARLKNIWKAWRRSIRGIRPD